MAAMGRLLCAGRAHCGGVSVGGGGRSRRERGAVGAPGGATGRAHSADGADGSPAPADAGEATAAQKSKNLYHEFRGTNVCTFVPPHFFSSLFRLTEFILPPPHPSVKESDPRRKSDVGMLVERLFLVSGAEKTVFCSFKKKYENFFVFHHAEGRFYDSTPSSQPL